MRDYIGLIAFISVIVGLMAGIVYIDQYIHQPWRCDRLSEMTVRNTQYVPFDGCYVEVNGEMVPKDRFVNVTGEVN